MTIHFLDFFLYFWDWSMENSCCEMYASAWNWAKSHPTITVRESMIDGHDWTWIMNLSWPSLLLHFSSRSWIMRIKSPVLNVWGWVNTHNWRTHNAEHLFYNRERPDRIGGPIWLKTFRPGRFLIHRSKIHNIHWLIDWVIDSHTGNAKINTTCFEYLP